jgi:hypothetical protein
MTTTFRARFEDGKLVPQEPVELPAGRDLEVEVRTSAPATPTPPAVEETQRSADDVPALLELAEQLDKLPATDSPSDAAAQHDHYLYGSPKRENP